MAPSFSTDGVQALKRAFHAGEELLCPHCQVVMDRRAIPPRSDISYVRDRVWLSCPSCHGTLVVDRREGG